jgi:hypothetical protein
VVTGIGASNVPLLRRTLVQFVVVGARDKEPLLLNKLYIYRE